MPRDPEDVRNLGGRLWWLLLSICLAFTSMVILLWTITSFIVSCGNYGCHASTTDGDAILVLVGGVGLTLAWFRGLQWLDRHLGWRNEQRRLARAWIATRKRDRAPRATT